MLNSKASSLRVHLLSADFKDFNIQNLKPMHFPNGVFCIDTPNIPAVLISNIINIPFAFNQLLMSANVYFLREGHFSLEAKILTEKGWSGWFNFGLFGTNRSESVSGQSNDFGIMDTDILKCHSYCTAIQYRLKIFANDKAFINAVSFVTTDTQKKYSEYGNDVLLPKTVINVAPISQMTQSSERAKDLCSPTAVTMTLSCAGIKTDVLNTAGSVLVKGSRFMRMERVLQWLAQNNQEEACCQS